MYKHLQEDKAKTEKVSKEIQNLQIENSDVFLLGYAKSGTTWAQEMVWLVMNDLDYERAKAFIDERVPVLEMSEYVYEEEQKTSSLKCHWNSIEFIKNMKNPRCIKTHLHSENLPKEIVNGIKKPKIIYIARNPKDVCLSYYYYLKNLLSITDCTLEEYVEFFLKGYNDRHDDYWKHVLYFWERRNCSNILFIKYEEMKHDLANVIRKVATFLEKTLTEEDVLNLVKWLDFDTMKNNEAVNHNSLYKKSGFIRSGKIGEHKEIMSDKMIRKFDSWIEENLRNIDYVV